MYDRPQNIVDVQSIINTCVARDIPTLTIDQNIGWLSRMKRDINFTINQLEQIKKERERSQKHRDMMNNVAREFYDADALDMDRNTRIQIIIQRIGCNKQRAESICDLIEQWCARQKRLNRNQEICLKHANGKSKASLAREYGLSRQHIYNILADAHRYLYFKRD